ncbi:hypothetical protein AAMO2058_000880200 [Amorphochlora amoebiformis]
MRDTFSRAWAIERPSNEDKDDGRGERLMVMVASSSMASFESMGSGEVSELLFCTRERVQPWAGDMGRSRWSIRRWLSVAITSSILLWLPIFFKLIMSGELGCGDKGCEHNVRSHIWETVAHILQGVVSGAFLLPWVTCQHSPDHLYLPNLSSSVRAVPRDVKKYVIIKNIVASVLMVAYPVYNLVKRWKTSKTDRHPESFWDSSFFVNEMMVASGFVFSLSIGCIALVLTVGLRGRPLMGGLSCEHVSFTFSAVPAMIFLGGVVVIAAVLSAREL